MPQELKNKSNQEKWEKQRERKGSNEVYKPHTSRRGRRSLTFVNINHEVSEVFKQNTSKEFQFRVSAETDRFSYHLT